VPWFNDDMGRRCFDERVSTTISSTTVSDHHCSTTIHRREGFGDKFLHRKSHGPSAVGWNCKTASARCSRQSAGRRGYNYRMLEWFRSGIGLTRRTPANPARSGRKQR